MPDYTKVCLSSQFTFLISEDKHSMRIHSAIVVETSKPLNANGIMKESTSKVAVLADVDPETFAASCEYAYTGTYTSPFVPPGEDDKKPTLS
ncbi:uncharacterized protein KD926_006406 [Aspergillus affinis]|uniref:uncharacterized protein n=1 Tax=Aspergillus affinis TaxID=1070780 RepID=UPI0022FDF2E1|nr:uncharacterized protein KD926_006406 [Aspergillus affinis]KAI9041861.1 hypothetical protein KD926_006406 [Aspergillus affinis]